MDVFFEFSSAPGEIQGEIYASDSLEKPQFLGMLEYNFLSAGWV